MSPKRVLDPSWRAAWRHTWLALRPWNQHSLVLTTLGFLYSTLGLVWAFTPSPSTRAESLVVLLHFTDGSMVPLGLAWVAVGLLAVLSARWPPSRTRWGYMALGMLTSFWGAMAVAGWVSYGTRWYVALSSAVIYTAFTVLIVGISGLTAPIPAPPAPQGPPPDGS